MEKNKRRKHWNLKNTANKRTVIVINTRLHRDQGIKMTFHHSGWRQKFINGNIQENISDQQSKNRHHVDISHNTGPPTMLFLSCVYKT